MTRSALKRWLWMAWNHQIFNSRYTGWWFATFIFPPLGIVILIDNIIFFRGVETTSTEMGAWNRPATVIDIEFRPGGTWDQFQQNWAWNLCENQHWWGWTSTQLWHSVAGQPLEVCHVQLSVLKTPGWWIVIFFWGGQLPNRLGIPDSMNPWFYHESGAEGLSADTLAQGIPIWVRHFPRGFASAKRWAKWCRGPTIPLQSSSSASP